MTPDAASRRLERFAAELPAAADRAIEETQKAALDRAIWWSSGGITRAQQRKMRGPYARAEHGQPRPDPARINVQGRGVLGGWVISPVENHRGSIYNTAPHARFLYDTDDAPKQPDRGTARMVGRPLPERVMAEIEPRMRELLETAFAAIMGD